MTDRIEEFAAAIRKNRVIKTERDPTIHWYYLEGFYRGLHKPFEIREASARLHYLSNMPVYIRPYEYIAGDIYWNEPLAVTYTNTHIRQGFYQRIMESETVSKGEKAQVDEMIEAVRPFCFDLYKHLTEEERRVCDSRLAPTSLFNGHVVPDYAMLIDRGLDALENRISELQKKNNPRSAGNFYEAMILTVQGIRTYILRYAELARHLLEIRAPGYDDAQLRHIERVCEKIAHEPCDTFPEALQMTWFILTLMDYDSLGRIDRYTERCYRSSRDMGMTEDEALTWLKYFFLKTEESDAIVNTTIGGCLPDGSSGVNDVTYLVLRATGELGFRSPNLSLRIREDDSDRLWEQAHLSISNGCGIPALYNDRLFTEILLSMGYAPECANDYCFAGCSQLYLPGYANFSCDVGCYNTLKALELALHDGRDALSGVQVGPRTGSAGDIDSFERLTESYTAQVRYMAEIGSAVNDKDFFLRRREGACVRSLFVHDCVEKGTGIFNGGARYYAIQNEIVGLTNTANALAAVRKLVFEDGTVGLTELVRVLDSDWKDNRPLREMCLKAPKFGNDHRSTDELRAWLSAQVYEELAGRPCQNGGSHWPGEVVFLYHTLHGSHTAASADGRAKGDPLASSAGASTATDISGPTAECCSMLRLPQKACSVCCVLNLRFEGRAWYNSRAAVIHLVKTYFSGGGAQVQINTVAQEELLRAMEDPAGYADLVVRVGGFSDYFVRLAPELQQEIVQRNAMRLY